MNPEDEPPEVLYELRDPHVAWITLNRPTSLNAMNRALLRRLGGAFEAFVKDDDAWVGVVTGAGTRAFSAGADLKEMRERRAHDKERTDPFWRYERPTIVRGLKTWKPLIAAVNGVCMGGGLELALACDLRLAAAHATFAQAEVRRGFIPGGGGTQRLPRAIPLGMALELLFTGDTIDAPEALRIGLVNHVYPADELEERTMALAARICTNGPLAVRAAKEAALRGLSNSLDEGLRIEAMLSRVVRTTEDSREGPRAFAERREPRYRGS